MENINVNQENNVVEEEPKCLDKWSWGGFTLGIVWGVTNGYTKGLLMLIPFFNIVYMFILGAKGNRYIWEFQKGKITPELFDQLQYRWNILGIIRFVLLMIEIIIPIFSMASLTFLLSKFLY